MSSVLELRRKAQSVAADAPYESAGNVQRFGAEAVPTPHIVFRSRR